MSKRGSSGYLPWPEVAGLMNGCARRSSKTARSSFSETAALRPMPRTLPPIWAKARPTKSAAICCLFLNDNTSSMTAIGNDYASEDIFMRQLENFAQPGDLVLALASAAIAQSGQGGAVGQRAWFETLPWSAANAADLRTSPGTSSPLSRPLWAGRRRAHDGLHLLCYAFMENSHWAKA